MGKGSILTIDFKVNWRFYLVVGIVKLTVEPLIERSIKVLFCRLQYRINHLFFLCKSSDMPE